MLVARAGNRVVTLGEFVRARLALAGLGLHTDYETCGPLDFPCIQRNAVRQQEDIAEREETNRLSHLQTCEANCNLNPTLPCYCAQYGGSDRPGTVGVPAGPSYQPVPQAAPPAPAAYVVSASIVNLTAGGSSFKVGDRYKVEVHGQPNQAVTVSASQNNKALPDASFGNTDATGVFRLEGLMGAEHVGSWVEVWKVGGQVVGTVSFAVNPAPAAATTTTTTTTPAPAPARPGADTEGSGGVPSFADLLKSVPTWAYLAGAGLVVLMMRGR